MSQDLVNNTIKRYKKYKKRKIRKKNILSSDIFGGTVYNNPMRFLYNYAPFYLESENDFIEPWQVDLLLQIKKKLNLPENISEFSKLDFRVCRPLRVAMCGGRNTGKTFITTIIILWLMHIFSELDSSMIAYSGKESQLKRNIFDQLYAMVEDHNKTFLSTIFHKREAVKGQNFYCRIYEDDRQPRHNKDPCLVPDTWSVFAPDKLRGIHKQFNFIVVDEAQNVPQQCFDAWEGIFTSGISVMILTGNGTIPESFYSKVIKEGSDHGWIVKKISVDDCQRIPKAQKEEIKKNLKMYHDYENLMAINYHGEIGTHSIDTFFDIRNFEETLQREVEHQVFFYNPKYGSVPLVLGIDVGAGVGKDYTCIFRYDRQNKSLQLFEWNNTATVSQTAELVKEIWSRHPTTIVNIDADGVGRTLIQELRNNTKIHVNAIHGGARVPNFVKGNIFKSEENLYKNIKSMLYAKLKEFIDRTDTEIDMHYNFDAIKAIRREVLEIKISYDKGVSISDKSEMGISPDIFDAMSYCFWGV